MCRIISIIFFIAWFPFVSYSQKWINKYYLNNNPSSVSDITWAVEAYDKGFYIAADDLGTYNIRIYKTDVNGNVLWERILGNNIQGSFLGGIATTADGGLVISGNVYKTDTSSTSDIFLIKLNVCGSIDWSEIYALNQNCFPGPVAVLKNGDFIVESEVNISKDSTPNYYNSWTFCADSQGKVKWSNFDNLFSFVMTLDKNDNILTTGHVYRDGLNVFSGLDKTDSSGVRLWQTFYGLSEHFSSLGVASVGTNGDGYFSAATKADTVFNLLLIKYDEKGGPQWQKSIGDTSMDECPINMIEMDDSTFLMSAISGAYSLHTHPYSENLKLLKITSEGQVLKKFVYPNSGIDMYFWSIKPTSDGKFIIAGQQQTNNWDSIVVLKINKNLELDSFYTNDKNKYDYLCSHKIILLDTIKLSTDTMLVTISFPLDIPIAIKPGSFTIYPNPSSGGIINILCPNANTPTTAMVCDVLDRFISRYNFISGNMGEAQINSGLLASGCYTITVEQNGKKYVQKLIIE
jgi:hypothetical protein